MPDLERDLVALGARLAVPADDYLATRVRAAIDDGAPKRRRRLLIVVAFLVAIGVVSAPVAADWLRVGRIEVRQEPPPATVAPSRFELGQRTTLSRVRAAVGFDVVVPTALGAPDEVWLDRSGGADVVWLAYRPRVDLPEAPTTGYGALVAQLDGAIDADILGSKLAGPGTRIERVEVGTGRALWIDGIHQVALRGRGGDFVFDRLRLSDQVLLWERGDVTLRLESSLDRDASLRMARSAG